MQALINGPMLRAGMARGRMNSIPEAVTDQELLRRAREGDETAFRQILERYQGKIYSLALRMMRNAEDAEEVLQETFISAHRALDRFQEKSALGTWLYRIATNAALMRLRGKKPVFVSLDEPREEGGTPMELVDFSADPLHSVLDQELRGVMEEAVSQLPDDMRTVFLLRDVEGLGNSEVADILDLTVPAVKSRLHRTRLHLRKSLGRYFAERDERRPEGAARS